MSDDGFDAWGKHILADLARLNKGYERNLSDIIKLREEMAMLKVKAGIWGAVGGIIPVMAALLIRMVHSG